MAKKPTYEELELRVKQLECETLDLKSVEAALRKSEEKYRNIYNRVQVGIFRTSLSDGKVLECNDRFAKTYGFDSREECINNYVVAEHYVDPEARERMLARLEEFGEISDFEARFYRRDGKIVWIRFSAVAFHDEGFLEGFGYDVTREKAAEVALRESEEKYRGLVEGLNDAVYRMALPEGRYEYFSSSAEDVFGYTSEEFINNPLLIQSIIHPDSAGYFEDKWKELLEGNVEETYEYKIIDSEGNERWIVQSNRAIFDDSGQIKAIEGLCQNVTGRKEAEMQLRLRSLVLNQIQDRVTVTDLDGVIKYVNDAEARAMGYSRDELIGVSTEKFGEDPERGATQREIVQETLEHGQWRGEVVNRTADGQEVIVDLRTRVVFDEQGRKNSLAGISTDITERKRAEAERENLQAQLIQAHKMEAIGTLSGGIAHDFNNILSPLMIHAEMALMELPSDSPLQRHVKKIYQSSERARDLVKQILTFARKQEAARAPIKVSLMVKETAKFLRSTIPTTIDIQYDIRTEQDLVLGDPTELNQLIVNLSTNAAHAMEERGGSLVIRVENETFDARAVEHFSDMEPGPYVVLRVEDTGEGIEPQVLDKIFEPYFTTKETGKGTGIGLAVVHGIVKSYGGDITVGSDPGKGACFTVYLPQVRDDGDRTQSKNGSFQLPRGNERILFVDDEEAALGAIPPMLEALGYSVTAKRSSVKALAAFTEDPGAFDLIITDQTMPGMTGKELAREMLAIRPELPIILYTGYSPQIDEERAKAMGIQGFVMKPIVMKEMANTIREVLDSV